MIIVKIDNEVRHKRDGGNGDGHGVQIRLVERDAGGCVLQEQQYLAQRPNLDYLYNHRNDLNFNHSVSNLHAHLHDEEQVGSEKRGGECFDNGPAKLQSRDLLALYDRFHFNRNLNFMAVVCVYHTSGMRQQSLDAWYHIKHCVNT